ncbi:hypothetical protein [Janibacter terrae]|uniref:hypothetical protein n=1 Tax=Janibacter terrae TaxID=103817 RepID=UPI0037FE6D89
MRIEIMYFVGWVTVPMVAYTSAQWAIRHSNQHSALRTRTDAAGRLDEMRTQRVATGATERGRMTEAIRLAENAAASAALMIRRG